VLFGWTEKGLFFRVLTRGGCFSAPPLHNGFFSLMLIRKKVGACSDTSDFVRFLRICHQLLARNFFREKTFKNDEIFFTLSTHRFSLGDEKYNFAALVFK